MDQRILGFLKNHKDRIYNTEGFFDIFLTYSTFICLNIFLISLNACFFCPKQSIKRVLIVQVYELWVYITFIKLN